MKDKAQAPTAARRAKRKLPKWLEKSSPVLKAKSDPSRLTVSWTPKAMAISLFLNQRASMALWATTKGSDPAPKMNRPRKTSGIERACQTMIAPARTRTENRRLDLRVPSLSMSMPPKRTTRMAAMLYIVFIVPTVARAAFSSPIRDGAIAPMMS